MRGMVCVVLVVQMCAASGGVGVCRWWAAVERVVPSVKYESHVHSFHHDNIQRTIRSLEIPAACHCTEDEHRCLESNLMCLNGWGGLVYKVSNGNCTPVLNSSAPVYITIGDGGNIEGLANKFTEPQPSYSAYREASFGHAMLEIKNQTRCLLLRHRNGDGSSLGDSRVLQTTGKWYPHEESSNARMRGLREE
ncbi:hypothetical protein IFM89_032793 [Coptis chinensis]|uniref:Purple acid phosphatase C-terminal domain-containing protein n=1 Tax=Coptis chinensis TaxID=261450 RepID=A0A835ME52_9MAGN|nr:hypothetical protein IFM89_032793 [Coptis chinensis]